MPGLMIGGSLMIVDGLTILNGQEDPRLRLHTDDYAPRRTRWIRGLVFHTTSGEVCEVRPGTGPDFGIDRKVVSYWTTSKNPDGTPKHAGAHLVVDADGSVVCCSDLLLEAAYHAGSVNDVTIGIELGQHLEQRNGRTVYVMYEQQFVVAVALADFITRRFGIPRQVQRIYRGVPFARANAGGHDLLGIYFHRDITDQRGQGDAGDQIVQALLDAGYKPVDFAVYEDKALWEPVQRQINATPGPRVQEDGIAGPTTMLAAEARLGMAHGQLVQRPGD